MIARVSLLCLACVALSAAQPQFSPAGIPQPDVCGELPLILCIGSSTVFPAAELYARQYSDDLIAPVVRSSGSGIGIQDFLTGATDVGHASRAMRQSDYDEADCDVDNAFATGGPSPSAACQGIFPVATQIGKDLIAVISSVGLIATITTDELAQFFPNGSTPIPSLQTVFPGVDFSMMPGVNASLPPALKIPDSTSGTFDFFFDQLLGSQFDPLPYLDDVETFTNDVDLINACAGVPNCLGFVGVAFADDSTSIQVVPLADSSVTPLNFIDPLTASDSDAEAYFFFRPLFFYTDSLATGIRAQRIRRYTCGIISTEGQQFVTAVGYRGLSEVQKENEFNQLGCEGLVDNNDDFGGAFEQLKYCRDRREVIQFGSSTVFPVANQYALLNQNDWLLLAARSAGSGPGIQNLIAGATDIGTASRAIRGSDFEEFGCPASGVVDGVAVETCQGILPFGVNIGFDTLAVIVNGANNWVQDLDLTELATVFAACGDSNTLWSSFGAGIVNGSAPDAPIECFIPDSLSGTRAFFEDEVEVTIPIAGFNDDEPIVDGVAMDVNAIGFVGFAFIASTTANVQVVSIDGVDITDSDVDPATYDLTRPLFLYYDGLFEAYRLEVTNQICFALSPEGQDVVSSVGYVALTEMEIMTQLDLFRLNCPCEQFNVVGC